MPKEFDVTLKRKLSSESRRIFGNLHRYHDVYDPLMLTTRVVGGVLSDDLSDIHDIVPDYALGSHQDEELARLAVYDGERCWSFIGVGMPQMRFGSYTT